jgi:peptidoglycan/xylan/chitin deacetylase (PgdA/CDA1 family)
MYHGVTLKNYHPPVWTQLPVQTFRDQLEFLRRHYRIISLSQLLQALAEGTPLPERAALITFDDGLKNNYLVAFPVLKELGLPACIFLTVDLIGSREMFWFDELYLLIREGGRKGVALELPGEWAQRHYLAGEIWPAYAACVEATKRAGAEARAVLLEQLRRTVSLEREGHLDDFGLLAWEEVRQMERSGLVGFGVHTATHRILAELSDSELDDEVLAPRKRFARELGHEAESFCFPNGRPGLDFAPRHQELLRRCGYLCAFTTENVLFDRSGGGNMGIGRVPAGNDGTSDPDYFRLNTSGLLHLLKGR